MPLTNKENNTIEDFEVQEGRARLMLYSYTHKHTQTHTDRPRTRTHARAHTQVQKGRARLLRELEKTRWRKGTREASIEPPLPSGSAVGDVRNIGGEVELDAIFFSVAIAGEFVCMYH